MTMKLSNSKDCIKCKRAEVYGTADNPSIQCTSTDSLHYSKFNTEGRYCASHCSGYQEGNGERLGNIAIQAALPFMLAGRSEFVLYSTKTNQDFSYKMDRRDSYNASNENDKYIYFLQIKAGADWIYAGVVKFDEQKNEFVYFKGAKGNIETTHLHIRSLIFVINKLYRGEIPGNCEIFHTGKCGKCGKKLTTPESILTGLGPSCAKASGVPRVKIR